jgi:hypothetical protein
MSDWIGLNGCNTEKVATLFICGGCADWWNYRLFFDSDGDYSLFIHDSSGCRRKDVKLVYHIDGDEVKEVYDIDEYELGENEVIIDYDFFKWD